MNMVSEDYYKKLPESVQEELRRVINITDNEEFVPWVITVPDEVKEQFKIPGELISEIRISEQYQEFSHTNDQNRYGFIPDNESDLAFRRSNDSDTIRTEIIDKVPSKVSLCNRYNGVQDQGNIGSCVGFGIEGAMRSAIDFKFPLSPAFAYQVAKLMDGNQREGTSLTSCIKGIDRYGLCREATYPYQSDKIYKDIPARVFREARNIRLIRYQDQKTTDYNLLEWMVACLSGAHFDRPLAVAIGALVYKSSWITDSGKLLEPYPGEKPSSGHSVTIVGYVFDSSFPGGGYFIFRNSWGSNWARIDTYCPAGYGIMSFQYAAKYIREAMVAVEMKMNANEPEQIGSDAVQKLSNNEANVVFAKSNEQMEVRENNHTGIIGLSGCGKTTLLKKLIIENEATNFIIDVHGDFANDKEFVSKSNSKVWDIMQYGFPYNILKLNVDEDDHQAKRIQLASRRRWIISCLKSFRPNLGSRQLHLIENELDSLISRSSKRNNDIQISHLLNSLQSKERMSREMGQRVTSVLENLKGILEDGILDCRHDFSLKDLVNNNQNIIFKCKVPNHDQDILRMVSLFLVYGIFITYKMTKVGKKRRGVIIQDEFHLMPQHNVWKDITTEGRKFNIELWVSSQKIEEMKELLPNLGRKFIFRIPDGNEARQIARLCGITRHEKDEIEAVLTNLEKHEFFDPHDVLNQKQNV